jgi:hypothetical protein
MVARSTPDRKVGGSIPSRVITLLFYFVFTFFMSPEFIIGVPTTYNWASIAQLVRAHA